VRNREIERERAALTGRADQPDLAAEQRGQFAADREAEARAAVLRLVPASACWKA
jgi:hypothetical protein